jgi:hypothetical protein
MSGNVAKQAMHLIQACYLLLAQGKHDGTHEANPNLTKMMKRTKSSGNK